eukprot:3259309-Pyramimonas_sp.AAC.1
MGVAVVKATVEERRDVVPRNRSNSNRGSRMASEGRARPAGAPQRITTITVITTSPMGRCCSPRRRRGRKVERGRRGVGAKRKAGG